MNSAYHKEGNGASGLLKTAIAKYLYGYELIYLRKHSSTRRLPEKRDASETLLDGASTLTIMRIEEIYYEVR